MFFMREKSKEQKPLLTLPLKNILFQVK